MNEEFEAYRALLFTIAYRMTGSAADAEDLVQDAYVRFASADRDVVRDVKAFLVTILTRLALDRLKSAQKQREEYIGPWLPEPVLTGIDGDPYARATRDEQVELALLRALERLSPQERAVLLLHDVLEHDHNEIADLLGITPASSRQILHRAKERVAEEKRRFAPPPEEQRRLIESFMGALSTGDVAALRNVLAADVVSIGDGGGKTFAAKRPIHGVDAVSQMWIGIVTKFAAGIEVTIEEVNGALAIVGWRDGVIENILTFTFEAGRIAELVSIVNPEKLEFARRQSRASHPPGR
ncbi:MAG TPA: RNA polymerase sigma-70 factor [Thermoanaerobaculia bacterium]|nr:RNA polymerase sigma-70 factor [Thermoanaerobaculia bacterium]